MDVIGRVESGTETEKTSGTRFRGEPKHIEVIDLKLFGADGRSRTGTSIAHYPLKIACLPIPPHRHLSRIIE